MMAENAVKTTPSAGGAGMGKMRKNVAKKSTTKPSSSLLKQTATLSDPNMVTLAARLKVVMNGQQKNAPNQGRTDGMAKDQVLTNGTDLDAGSSTISTGTDGCVSANKGNVSVVDNGDHQSSQNIAANQGDGDNSMANLCEQNLDRNITSTCSGKSPGQNGTHGLKLGQDNGQKPKSGGLIITAQMNSYVRSLAKVAASHVDVSFSHVPSGGTSCSSTTHIPESTTPSKIVCNKGNLFDNLTNLSNEHNGGCDLDGKGGASSDSATSLDEITGKLTQAKATPTNLIANAADDGAIQDKDILMDGVDDDATLSDVDDSILDDPSDQKLTVSGADRKHCTHATSDNKNLTVKPVEKVDLENTNLKGQLQSNCDTATVKCGSNLDTATVSVVTAASNTDIGLETDSEAKHDTDDKPSSITQLRDVTAFHRKRVMLEPAETEPKKKLKFEDDHPACADNQANSGVDSSCVSSIMETSSSVAAVKNSTGDELGAIDITLGELDRLIKKHIHDDGSVLSQLQEKIALMQANTESWKRKMTELQNQVAEITKLQQQHDLRRSHLRHRVQTRNWGVQVDEQKIQTALHGTPSPAKTIDTSTTKTEPSSQPTVSTSVVIQSSLGTVQSTMSESAVRSVLSQTPILLTASSETTVRPVMAERVVRSSVSETIVQPPMLGTTVRPLFPFVTATSGSTVALMPVGTLLSQPALPTGTMVSTQLNKLTPTVQQILNHCVTSSFNVKLQVGGSICTLAQAPPASKLTTAISAKKIIDLTDDDDEASVAHKTTVQAVPIQTVGVRPTLNLPAGQLIVRQPLSSTPLQPGTFILQSSGANPGTLYLQPTGVRGVAPPRPATTSYIIPNQPAGGSGTFVLQPVASASNTAPTVTLTQPLPRLQGVSTGMLLMTRPPPPLQSAPGVLVKTRLEKPVEKLHPAPLPVLPVQKSDISLKLMPTKPSLKISRVQQGIVLSWSMNLDDSHAKISKYQLFAYQEGTQTPHSGLWKKIGDVNALPLPMACTLTQFQEGNKYHFAVRAVDIHERLGVFSDPSSIHLTKTV